jgi:hypothetical protein
MKDKNTFGIIPLFAVLFASSAFCQLSPNVPFTTDASCLTNAYCNAGAGGVCKTYKTVPGGLTTGRCSAIFCTVNSQCPTSESCQAGICTNTCTATADCHFGQTCQSGKCLGVAPGHVDYCIGSACPRHMGDCDSDAQCSGTLDCVTNIGTGYGYSSTTDVCTDYVNGNADFCKNYGPCSWGEGDCDSNSECEFGLVCKLNRGAEFGLDAADDMCMWPWQ